MPELDTRLIRLCIHISSNDYDMPPTTHSDKVVQLPCQSPSGSYPERHMNSVHIDYEGRTIAALICHLDHCVQSNSLMAIFRVIDISRQQYIIR